MKIHLTFVVICVVAIFALPQQRSTDEVTQNGRHQLNKDGIEPEHDDQELVNGDQSINNLIDDSLSSNETTTTRKKPKCGRRHHIINIGNITDSNQKRCRHRLSHLVDSLGLDRQNENQVSAENSDSERKKHHRHHHHRHHHHHKNKTSTTLPTSTASTVFAE